MTKLVGAARASVDTVVRTPNHLGDLVMALPALEAAGGADMVVVRGLAPLVALARLGGRVTPLDRGSAGFLRAARELRRRRYRRGVLLPPSFSSAALFAVAGVEERIGTATDSRAPLLTEAVPARRVAGLHRTAVYYTLVTGATPPSPPAPRLAVPDDARERWHHLVGDIGERVLGIFPGSNASSRRWDPDRFAAIAQRFARRGWRVVVFGGPGDRPLTAQVAGRAALDLGGRTDLPLLAAGLAACELLVSNDSGPLHLAAAVGTPTVSLWGAGDPRITGPLGSRHAILRHPELPCVPCLKNECPRRGAGYVLPDAVRECVRLTTVEAVEAAAVAHSQGLPVGAADAPLR